MSDDRELDRLLQSFERLLGVQPVNEDGEPLPVERIVTRDSAGRVSRVDEWSEETRTPEQIAEDAKYVKFTYVERDPVTKKLTGTRVEKVLKSECAQDPATGHFWHMKRQSVAKAVVQAPPSEPSNADLADVQAPIFLTVTYVDPTLKRRVAEKGYSDKPGAGLLQRGDLIRFTRHDGGTITARVTRNRGGCVDAEEVNE